MNTASRRLAALALLTCVAGCGGHLHEASFTTPPATRERLPRWAVDFPQPAQIIRAGERLEWLLRPRDDEDIAGAPADGSFAAAVLPVEAGERLHLRVKSTRGAPVLLITDRPWHPLDRGAAREEVEPGHPVAFASGRGGQVELSLDAQVDGELQVWVWVLRGPLAPAEDIGSTGAPALDAVLREAGPSDAARAWTARPAAIASSTTAARRSSVELTRTAAAGVEPTTQWPAVVAAEGDSDPQRAWAQATAGLARARGRGLQQARSWRDACVSMVEDFTGSQHRQLQAWAEHPGLLAALLRRDAIWRDFAEDAQAERWIFAELGERGGELELLTNDAAGLLAALLPSVGARSAALVDAHGLLIASTDPFARVELVAQDSWRELTGEGLSSVHTPSYALPALDLRMRSVAVPVWEPSSTELAGWLLVELYAGPGGARSCRPG